MKSIKVSEFIKITKPDYKYYKLTPNNSIRNQSTHKIAKAIISLYRNLFQRIKREETKLIKLLGKEFMMGTKYSFEMHEKIAYFIYIEKGKVEFYFIIPNKHEALLKDKISDAWAGVTIKEVDEIPKFKESAVKYQMQYSKEDALSLSVDRRNNELLRSNLNIINVLDENDKVGLYYNFIPVMQHSWRNQYKNTMVKVKSKEPVDRNKGKLSYILKYTLTMLTNLLDDVLGAIVDDKGNNKESILGRLNGLTDISGSTIKKENAMVLDAQMVVFSESDDKIKQISNAKSLTQGFDGVSDDNRLIAKRRKKQVDFNSYRIKSAPTNRISDVECQNFISLAGKDILEEYNFIDKVSTQETQVPDELQRGTVNIGVNTYRGHKQEAYLSDDAEYKNLTTMLVGPTRSGKSTLIGNISNDALNNGECVIMFDYIKNCELSEEVSALFPKDKVLNIECNNFDKLQGLGYNEVGHEDDTFKQYDNAKRQTTQLMTLANSVNADEVNLTAKMERYLTSAALISFISNGSIKDVFDILQDHNVRNNFINKVPSKQHENLGEYITSLRSLDDYNKDDELIGTKLNLIVGIIDRLNKLKANTYMELMLKKGTEGNFDLSEEIQRNQLICLKMPEDMFSTDGERDVYATYWITKLWLALQMRGKNVKDRSKHRKVNLIIDEIYQVNNTEKFLTEKLSRLAKFGIKPIISCHYINQLKYMRNELRSANASYMLISGCDKNNYNEFKEELYPFELDDLLKLPRYNSLNLIKHKDGYGKFITRLPKPVMSSGDTHNNHISLEENDKVDKNGLQRV